MKLVINNRTTEQLKANLLTLGIISLVTIVVWVGTSVYFSYTKSSVRSDVQTLIKPINPSLDADALAQFQTSRLSLPETFQIYAQKEVGTKTTAFIIDPFSNQSYNMEVPTASLSASAAAEISE